MDRRSFLEVTGAAASVGAVGALAGCSALTASGDYDVGMTAVAFDPVTVAVPAGSTVVWKNTSSHAHTVTAYETGIPDGAPFWSTGEFDSQAAAEEGWTSNTSGALYAGDTFERTFDVPGTHHYYCIPHEASGMTGKVVVTENSSTATSK